MLEWLHNEERAKWRYWQQRGELLDHAYRKSYLARIYDTSVLVVSEPRATDCYTVEELRARGIVGFYGVRRG